MTRNAAAVIAVLAFLTSQTVTQHASQDGPLPFSCATFGANVDEEALKVKFGAANVTTGLVGDYNEGTILFADRPDAQLMIYWRDRTAKRTPEWVDISGSRSRWRSPGGVTLGDDLKTVERLNGRPFRLNGWGTDLGGALYSWAGGRLARQDVDGCRIGFRFVYPDADKRPDLWPLGQKVPGDHSYSSGHPVMQALNPYIVEAVISNRVQQDHGGSRIKDSGRFLKDGETLGDFTSGVLGWKF